MQNNNYTIVETFTLPSKGLIYDPVVAPEITLRSMTTADEMRRLSNSEYQYKPMSDILDNCIVEGPQMSAYDMCIGDYQFLLYKLRIVTYGDDYKVETKCPYCGFTNSDKISLDAFPILELSDDIDKYREFELPVSKNKIKIRFQTPRLLDQVDIRTREAKKKSEDKSIDFSTLYMLTSMIDTVDGIKYDSIKLENWLRDLPMKDTGTIFAYADKLNNTLGINAELEIDCALCGLTYKLPFRPGATFFRPEIDI